MTDQQNQMKIPCNKCTTCHFRDEQRCLLENDGFGFGSTNGCEEYLIRESLVNFKVKKKDKKRPNKVKHKYKNTGETNYGEW